MTGTLLGHYRIAEGRLPFAADYEQAALYGILNKDPEPLTAVRTGVPMELEAVLAMTGDVHAGLSPMPCPPGIRIEI